MKTLFTIITIALSLALHANNISVSNVTITGQDVSAGTNNAANFTMLQFDLSWENSWRTSVIPNNWDAAWVFIKYRPVGGEWQHARLHNTGHTAPAGSAIDAGLRTPGSAFDATTNPGIGAFIYRSADGTGTFTLSGIQLRWNYGANGVNDNQAVDVQVFAIEMVYVPQGSFSAGSGGTETSAFYEYPTTTNAYQVASENAITVGTASGNLYYPSDGDQTGPIPAAFPKGYNAFYCMKYEITQQQYVDFLNTLTRSQQDNRTETDLSSGVTSVTNRYVMGNSSSSSFRQGIRCDATIHTSNPVTFYCDLNGNGTGGESDDGQWIACNYLSYMDVSAYLDWSGLRPFTELEFEKACRGTQAPVSNEYAWGTTGITAAANITDGGQTCETTNTSGANAVYNSGVSGPMRVGVFATGSTTRSLAGATFYGIMEMSGNLWERPVTIGNATGRAFTGVEGDGALSANGHANETAWPGLTTGEVTGATGAGFRGGGWGGLAILLRVSDRNDAAFAIANRLTSVGGRGVRVAP